MDKLYSVTLTLWSDGSLTGPGSFTLHYVILDDSPFGALVKAQQRACKHEGTIIAFDVEPIA